MSPPPDPFDTSGKDEVVDRQERVASEAPPAPEDSETPNGSAAEPQLPQDESPPRPLADRILELPEERGGAELEARLLPLLAELAGAGMLERERVVALVAERWDLRLPVVRRLVAEATSGGGGADDDRDSNAERIIEIVEEFGLIKSPTGRVFVRIGSEAIPVDGRQFRARIADLFRARHGGTVSATTIDTAVLPLLGRELPVVDIPVRVGGDAARVLLDLADGSGRTIEITAAGVQLLDESPVCFFRPPSTLPLPVPVLPGGDDEARAALSAGWDLFSITDERGRSAVLAWLLPAMRRARVYPILVLTGPEGTAKTTRAIMLRGIIDPRDPAVRGLPKVPEDLMLSAENAHVLALDNLSRLSAAMSDLLCCLSTGAGAEARELYTTRDLAVFRASRPLVLTAITDIATRPDLLSRSLIVRLDRPAVAKGDEEVEAEFRELHPRLLGALCWVVSRGLAYTEAATIDGKIRMRAPAAFAAACEHAAGLPPGAIVGAYLATHQDALDIVAEEPVPAAILAWARERVFGFESVPPRDDIIDVANTPPSAPTWKGSASALYTLLSDRLSQPDDRGRATKKLPYGWPGSASALAAALRRFATSFRDLGVEVTFGTDGRGNDRTRWVQVTRLLERPSAKVGTPPDDSGNDLGTANGNGGNGVDLGAVPTQTTTKQDVGTAGTVGTAIARTYIHRENSNEPSSSTDFATSSSPEEEGNAVPTVPTVPTIEIIEEKRERRFWSAVPTVPTCSAGAGALAVPSSVVGAVASPRPAVPLTGWHDLDHAPLPPATRCRAVWARVQDTGTGEHLTVALVPVGTDVESETGIFHFRTGSRPDVQATLDLYGWSGGTESDGVLVGFVNEVDVSVRPHVFDGGARALIVSGCGDRSDAAFASQGSAAPQTSPEHGRFKRPEPAIVPDLTAIVPDVPGPQATTHRARVREARFERWLRRRDADPYEWWIQPREGDHPFAPGSRPGDFRLVVEVVLDDGRSAYWIASLHPCEPQTTIEALRAFGGEPAPDGRWVMAPVTLTVIVRPLHQMFLGIVPTIIAVSQVVEDDGRRGERDGKAA